MVTFEFFRFRFRFRALDPVLFPPGKGANVLRGALGVVLRDSASPAEYARLFRPGAALGKSPSGLADWPRPFVFRAAHLDGLSVPAGGEFFVEVHVFDLRVPALVLFREAFSRMAVYGLGPGRGRAELLGVDQIDLGDRATPVSDTPANPTVLSLEPLDTAVDRARVRFLTPTELKLDGRVAHQPEFPILFARLRDRLNMLRSLYGAGPIETDLFHLTQRAADIRLTGCQLTWAHVQRRSGRTGQVHPLGGFTGEAEYQGELREFLPWLDAAHWVGVGRQTVWGKGDLTVIR